MADKLNETLGPSIFLLLLDLFIDNPDQWMNLREIARRVNKNPGSISSAVKTLLERGFITDCKVGKVTVVCELNSESEKVKALLNLRNELKKTGH